MGTLYFIEFKIMADAIGSRDETQGLASDDPTIPVIAAGRP